MGAGTRLVDHAKLVHAFPPAVPSSAALPYVSLANYNHLTIVIDAANAGTGVTGSAVTLAQAQDTSGTGAKALAFALVFANADTAAASDALTATAVASDTFTISAAAGKASRYVIEVDAAQLDLAGGFTSLKLGLANAAAQTVNVSYLLSGARYGGGVASFPSPLS